MPEIRNQEPRPSEQHFFTEAVREITLEAQNNQLNPDGETYPKGGVIVTEKGRSKIDVTLGETTEGSPIYLRANLRGGEITKPLVVVEDNSFIDAKSGLRGKRTFFAFDEEGEVQRTIQVGTGADALFGHKNDINRTYTPYDDHRKDGAMSVRQGQLLRGLMVDFSNPNAAYFLKRPLKPAEKTALKDYLQNIDDAQPLEELCAINRKDKRKQAGARIRVMDMIKSRSEAVKEQHEAAQRRRDSGLRALENPRRYR